MIQQFKQVTSMKNILQIIVIYVTIFTLATPVFAEIPNPFIPQLPVVVEPEPVVAPPRSSSVDDEGPRNPRNQQQTSQVEKVPEPPKIPNFALTGLVFKSDRPQAILNGNVVNIGDTVENAKIVNISKEGVFMEFEGLQLIVQL